MIMILFYIPVLFSWQCITSSVSFKLVILINLLKLNKFVRSLLSSFLHHFSNFLFYETLIDSTVFSDSSAQFRLL